jgi:hypothetical protein
MMMPTAMSTTLPLRANSLNSLSIDMSHPPFALNPCLTGHARRIVSANAIAPSPLDNPASFGHNAAAAVGSASG